MKITIRIPKGFKDDIEIDLTYGDEAMEIPFADGFTNEEVIDGLDKVITHEDLAWREKMNEVQDYLMENMGMQPEELGTFGDTDEVNLIGE